MQNLRAALDHTVVVNATWELVEEQPGSCGNLPTRTRRYRVPDGTRGGWDIFSTSRSVAVLALTDAKEVVLARQRQTCTEPVFGVR